MIFENKKSCYCFSIVFLIFYSLIVCLLSNAYFMADDYGEGFMRVFTFKELFVNSFNNSLFTGMFSKFFGFCLPKIFNMHPSDFKGIYFPYIGAFFLLGILFIICKLFYQKKKINFTFSLYFIFSILLFFLCLRIQEMLIWIYPGMSRMLAPTFFYIILFLMIANIIKNKEFSFSDKIFLPILVLLSSTTNEMIALGTILTLILLLIYSSIKKTFVIEKKFLIILISYSIFGLLFYGSAFFRKFDSGNPLTVDSILNLMPLLGEFLSGYLKLVILNQIVPLLLITFSSILISKKGTNQEENKNIISLVLFSLFSYLTFFFLLFFMGKTEYNGGFWIEHSSLMTMFNLYLSAAVFVLFRQLLEQKILIKKYFIIFILILCFGIGRYDFNYYNDVQKKMFYQKREAYKLEKIYRLASQQERVALLPDTALEIGYLWCFYEADWNNLNRFKEKIHYDSDFTRFYQSFESVYMFRHGFIYIPKEEAYADFKKNGGTFSLSEFKNPRFTNLLNKDFLYKE